MRYEEYDSLILGKEESICYIVDFETYEMVHLTRKGMELFGLKEPEEYLGQKCYKLLQGLDCPCPFCTNGKLELDKTYRWEHFNDRLQRWMDVEDTLVNIDGRLCRMEHARDITTQKEKMQRLSDRLTLEQILVKCLRTLASVDDYDFAFNSFLEQLGRFYRANRAYIFEFDHGAQTTSNTYEWCAPTVTAEIGNLQNIPIEHISRWLKKFHETGEFFINSLDSETSQDSEEYRILADQGIQSLLAAPLKEAGTIIGFIGVDDPTNATGDLTLLRASSDFVVEELKKRRLIERLERASYIDMLTGLHNRNWYTERLKEYESTPPSSLGVVFADVNGMKSMNDTYGHKYGDKLLVKVSDLLKQSGGAEICRIGGDEFVLLFENCSKEEFQKQVLALRVRLEEDRDCDVSLGYVWEPGGKDVNSQIIRADELMYAEKQTYYKSVLSKGHPVRTGIADEVVQEILDRSFVVYYQPQINIKTNEIIGAEALVRKLGPGGELIAPDRFIPFYEIGGVIRHVDLFVLEEVCAAIRTWRAEGIDLNVSVNFSRVTLMEPGIVDEIERICSAYGVPAQNLTIEVTESIGGLGQDQLRKLMSSLIQRGFTLSLDDFGSKYSNLSVLNDMNFHTVKLDKTLVDQLEDSSKSRIILKNTIRMCQELNATHTLAEGIETEGQRVLLSECECEYGQGFFFSRPLPLGEFDEILHQARDNDQLAQEHP